MPNVCNGSGNTIDPTRSDGRLSANSGGNLLSRAMLAWMTAARRSANVQRQRESQHRTLTAARLSSSPPRMPPAAPQTARRTPVQTREIVPHHRVGHLRSRSGQIRKRSAFTPSGMIFVASVALVGASVTKRRARSASIGLDEQRRRVPAHSPATAADSAADLPTML